MTQTTESDKQEAALLALLRSAEVAHELTLKTNEEIASMLMDHVWAHLPITSAQSDLVDEAIMRLDPKRREIQEDES